MYSSTLPSTTALDGVGGQRHPAAALPTGKRSGTHCRPQGRSGRLRKISLLPEIDPRTVQPVASSYTDCAIPALASGRTFLHHPSANYYMDIFFNPLQAGNTRQPSLGETVRPREGVHCTDRDTEDALQKVANAVERFTPSVQMYCSEVAGVAARRSGVSTAKLAMVRNCGFTQTLRTLQALRQLLKCSSTLNLPEAVSRSP
jgi:hypothetical protein